MLALAEGALVRAAARRPVAVAPLAALASSACAAALPCAAAPARGMRTYERPTRLHETPRLRKVRKWTDFAPYVSSIKFRMDPAMDGTTAAKELWRQAAGRAIRRQFPKYVVELKETDDFGACEVAVAYTNGKTQVIPAQHLTLLDIFDVMSEVTDEILEKEELDELEKG